MKNYEEKLKKLRNLKKVLLYESIKCEEEKIEKINYEIKKIEDDYNKKQKNLSKKIENKLKTIEEYQNKIVFSSTFDFYDIINIIRSIIRIYEGENFNYCIVHYYPNSKRKIIQYTADVLVTETKENFIDKPCDKSKLYSISKKGHGIILDWDAIFGTRKHLSFYTLDKNGQLMPKIKLTKFPYLKDFIDYVISYCIENSISHILSLSELEKLKKEFIYSNKQNIKLYHENLSRKQETEYKEKLEKNIQYRNKQLLKVLNRRDKNV